MSRSQKFINQMVEVGRERWPQELQTGRYWSDLRHQGKRYAWDCRRAWRRETAAVKRVGRMFYEGTYTSNDSGPVLITLDTLKRAVASIPPTVERIVLGEHIAFLFDTIKKPALLDQPAFSQIKLDVSPCLRADLWVAFWSNGLVQCFDREGRVVFEYDRTSSPRPNDVNSRLVERILEDLP